MANSKQAIKRARQNSDRYKLRHAQRSVVRTAVKAVKADIDANDKAKANDSFKKAQKIIDTAAAKKVIHKNAAARTKSRLSKAIKNLAITSPFVNGEIEINGFIMTNRYLIHFQCCKMQIILTYRITAPITYPLIDLNNLMME